MAQNDQPNGETETETLKDAIDGQSITLRVIATLMLIGAAWAGAAILVPFMLALTLAVALSPVADALERRGAPRGLSSLACTLFIAALISGGVGLVLYQASTIVQNSDKYIKGFGTRIDDLLRRTHAVKAADTLGFLDTSGKQAEARPGSPAQNGPPAEEKGGSARPGQSPSRQGDGEMFLRRGLTALGGWLASGVGGLLGAIGGGVLFLAYLFYLLEGRHKWMESLTTAGRRLGLRPAPGTLEAVRHQVVMYVGCLSMIALAYAVVVSLLLWWIGVPQPILWGVLAGLLEVVPYFGALIASVLPTVVSLSLGSWWQPAAVLGMFVTLHLVEGYLIEPRLYGRAVRLDPVTILFGAVFFGSLWGPAGLAIATPMLIILRGLILITPDTPALDALTGARPEPSHKVEPVASSR